MGADLMEKTDRYEGLLAAALAEAEPTPVGGTPLAAVAEMLAEMADAYLVDGRHFVEDGDPVNALAAFAYGHAWLDVGARLGLFDVSSAEELFAV